VQETDRYYLSTDSTVHTFVGYSFLRGIIAGFKNCGFTRKASLIL